MYIFDLGFLAGKVYPTGFFQTVYDLSIWRIHWSFGLIALIGALLETDPDRAMALGALAAPYLQGYSYIVLLPVMTRLSGWTLIFVWLTSWAGVWLFFLAIPLDCLPFFSLFPYGAHCCGMSTIHPI